MRIARFSYQDRISFGIVDEEELVVLSGDPMFAGFDTTGERVPLSAVALLAPVIPRSKVVCVGKNYRDHAAEMGGEAPAEPLLFLKPNTAVIGPGDAIVRPPQSERTDFEGELAVVIGRIAKNVPAERALDHVFGFTVGNDVTARDLQKRDGQWARAKGFDTFCPLGPVIETEFDLNGGARVVTRVDGEVRQDGPISDMVHSVPELIAYASAVFTLLPGDVILTGTPAGIGPATAGETVEVEITGIGALRNPVRMPEAVVRDLPAIQRHTVAVLAAGQVLGGIAFGSTISLGALLAAELSGQESLSGLATASVTLGAALCAIPLARLAARNGRRFALSLGNLLALAGIVVVLCAAGMRAFPLLLVGVILIGAGNAGNLQSRFAATDLAVTERRARDLGTVVWATTVGGVLGPLLLGPGEAVGAVIGMPPLTGAYAFSLVAQIAALVLYLVALRPDPLLTANRVGAATTRHEHIVENDRPTPARYAMVAVAGSHAVMASVMAMTPVHLSHLAPAEATTIVGVTIAVHVFGMYGLSPLFGVLADRWRRTRTILLGQGLLAASLLLAAAAPQEPWAVLVALFLLGVGWSAATIAGAALLTEMTITTQRPLRQGLSDTLMTLAAAAGSVLAGIVLSQIGYGGLALVALVVVAVVVVLAPLSRVAEPHSPTGRAN